MMNVLPEVLRMDVQLQTVAHKQPTAVVRRRASLRELPKVVPDGCGVVWNTLRANAIKGAGRNLALYLDDQINLEVGVEMSAPFAGVGDVVASSLPAGGVATAVHFGPYQRLCNVHNAIRDWCKANGHSLAGPNWEIYGHWDQDWNSHPEKIRTDVYYLLKPADASAR
jgi:effector-binding domain-containing protein